MRAGCTGRIHASHQITIEDIDMCLTRSQGLMAHLSYLRFAKTEWEEMRRSK